MCSIESVELEIADKKIKMLEQELGDYQEFVKSADTYLNEPNNLNRYNLRTMCNYLMLRYQPTNPGDK